MTTKIKNGTLIFSDRTERNDLYITDGTISAVGGEHPFDDEIDAAGQYVAPGFIDMHVHGGAGFEFVDGTEEAVVNAVNIHASRGTTTIFPTISAYDREKTERAMRAVQAAMRNPDVKCHIGGVHLEGPYFSPKQCGAQDPAFIRTPDPAEYEAMIAEFGSLIRRWSWAPELPGSVRFLDCLKRHNIVASAGHTDAEFSHISEMMEHGLDLVTHLYSCTSTITRRGGFRILGVTECAYYFDDLDVEIIADGCHLPPELLKLVYKLKGENRISLITDAIRYGGCENVDNVSDPNGNVPYVIEDGVAKLADRSAFAGSIATADVLIRTCVEKAGIPLPSAVRMVTENPARVMGLSRKGKLEKGFDADIVFMDTALNVTRVILGN